MLIVVLLIVVESFLCRIGSFTGNIQTGWKRFAKNKKQSSLFYVRFSCFRVAKFILDKNIMVRCINITYGDQARDQCHKTFLPCICGRHFDPNLTFCGKIGFLLYGLRRVGLEDATLIYVQA
jgi:hypothetical protein